MVPLDVVEKPKPHKGTYLFCTETHKLPYGRGLTPYQSLKVEMQACHFYGRPSVKNITQYQCTLA
jgi:hypothetical protein